jgi:hypothetical protein
MTPMSLCQVLALTILTGCCSNWVDIDTFDERPLNQQIPEYERGMREHCIRRESQGLLIVGMASHGVEAATAMSAILEHPSPDFPPEDAIDVIEGVHAGGTDLRNDDSLRVLARIADTASDPFVRSRAKDTLERIRTHAPGELLRPPQLRH